MPEYDIHAEYLIGPNLIAAVHRMDSEGVYQSTDFVRRNDKGMLFVNYRCTTVTLPFFDEATEQARFEPDLGWVIEPKGVEVAEPPVTLSAAKKKKLADLAAYRYQRETGGLSVNGMSILTDRESQAQLTSAYVSLKFGLKSSIDWKGTNGWTSLTLAEIEPIAQLVLHHVQNGFTMEKIHSEAINNLTTVEEVNAYDITVGF